MGLVARCPISPFALPRQEANDRVVAGLCEFIYEGRVQKTVVGSVYAHADDEASAFDLVTVGHWIPACGWFALDSSGGFQFDFGA